MVFLRGDVSKEHRYCCGETGLVVRSGVGCDERGFDCDYAGSGGVADHCR